MLLYVRNMVVDWVGENSMGVHTEDDINKRVRISNLPEGVKCNKGDKICCAFIDKYGFDSINTEHVFMINIYSMNAERKPTVQTLFRDNVEEKYRFFPTSIDNLLAEVTYQFIQDAAITVVSNRFSIPKGKLVRDLYLHKRPDIYCCSRGGHCER